MDSKKEIEKVSCGVCKAQRGEACRDCPPGKYHRQRMVVAAWNRADGGTYERRAR